MPSTPPTERHKIYCDSLIISPTTIFTQSLSTRTSQLLESNAPILDVEKDSYRHIIKVSHSLLERFDKDIDEMGSALEVMKSNRDAIAMHRSHAMTITHPLRSLPPEMLKEIFHYASGSWSYDGDDSGTRDVLKHSHPLWRLSQVCAKWRDVALRDRTLWSFLGLDLTTYDEEDAPAYTRRLALFLERSRGCLLDVWIKEGPRPVFQDYPHMLALLETSTHRWRNFLSMLCASSVQLFSGCAFSALMALHLEPASSGGTYEVDIFKSARALRSLSVNSKISVAFDMPWSELESVLVDDVSFHRNVSRAVLDELGNMSQLVELVLTLPWKKSSRGGRDWTADSEVYSFPHMEKLSLYEIEVDEGEEGYDERAVVTLREIFSRLSMPSLKELRILSSTTMFAFPVLGHPNSLTSLDIHFRSGNTGILPFLATTTNVEVLVLRTDTSEPTHDLFDGLTLTGGADSNILQRLAHLDICRVLWPFSMDVLLPCLESRIGNGMQTVIVNEDCPGPDPQMVERWDMVHTFIEVIRLRYPLETRYSLTVTDW